MRASRTVLYADPARREEALQMLERARRIDPLEPGYDVMKAVFLLYERSDVSGADKLLSSVLERHPRYVPALLRQCEIRSMLLGRQADGIRLCEQALAVDPLLEQARRVLIRAYLDIEDPVAAEQLADTSRGDEAVPRAFLAFYRRDWTAAGEAAYEALERGTVAPDNAGLIYAAIRLHARTTGDAARAIAAIEPHARVEWDGNGKPTLRDSSALRDGAIALADLLILDGQVERGRRLLAEIIGTMERETRGEGRPELWYLREHPKALALDGQPDAALALLERSYASGQATSAWWFSVEAEPAYDALRKTPRFEALRRKIRDHVAEQRQELARLRKEGLVPQRIGGEP